MWLGRHEAPLREEIVEGGCAKMVAVATRRLLMPARIGVFIRLVLFVGLVLSGGALGPGRTAAAAGDQQPSGNQQPALDLAAVPGQARDRAETRHLTLRTSTGPVSRASARRVTLFVDVTPKPKMHVYSPEQPDVIPVALTIAPAAGLKPGPVTLPKPETYYFAPLDETQFVYSKPFRIALEVTLAAAAADPVTITGTLRYQACDDAICYLPQSVAVEWRVGGR